MYKRLFWFFDIHGGAAGSIALGGSPPGDDYYLAPDGFILQLVDVTGDPGTSFAFGTLAEPDKINSGWAPGDLITGAPRQILTTAFEVQSAPMLDSPWAFTITGGDLTAGVVEVYFGMVRAT